MNCLMTSITILIMVKCRKIEMMMPRLMKMVEEEIKVTG